MTSKTYKLWLKYYFSSKEWDGLQKVHFKLDDTIHNLDYGDKGVTILLNTYNKWTQKPIYICFTLFFYFPSHISQRYICKDFGKVTNIAR